MIEQHLRWCLDLHHRIAPDTDHPACWSPLSVACALGLVTQVARGTTRKELDSHLMLDTPGQSDSWWGLDQLAALVTSAATLNPLPGTRRSSRDDQAHEPQLLVANTVWVDDQATLAAGTGPATWSTWPGASVRPIAFARDPDASRSTINRDIADTTQGLIRDLLPPDAITSDTITALVNALFLRTSWRTPFPAHRTEDAVFHGPGGSSHVATMRVTAPMRYGHRLGWQIVDIPAVAGIVATVLLPDDPLSSTETYLDGPQFHALTSSTRPQRVELCLPLVRQRTRLSLTPPLKDSGVHTLFDERADLSGLAAGPLAVSDVLHEAVLRIDEHGVEGAAATAMTVMRGTPGGPAPITVRVDRPFLLAIRHEVTGAVYFLARITQP